MLQTVCESESPDPHGAAAGPGMPTRVRHDAARTRYHRDMDEDKRGSTAAGDLDLGVVSAARRGDARAFVQVLRHHDRLLRLVAYRVLGDRQQMDDIMQEVAIRAFRGLPNLRSDAAIGPWLCRLTYTTGIDAVRRRRPEDPTDDAILDRLTAPLVDDSLAVVDREALRSAFSCLTIEQQLSVLLVDRVGYDYDEAAEILRVAPGTVASRLSRARAVLRQALGLGAEPAAASSEDVQ